MAVFLVLGGLLASRVFIHKNGVVTEFGGVSIVAAAHGAQSPQSIDSLMPFNIQEASLLAYSTYNRSNAGGYVAREEDIAFDDDQGIAKDLGGVFTGATTQSGIVNYAVKKGDTLPSIAAYFGISVDTIKNANAQIKAGAIKPGMKLKILPVSGTLYTSQGGDTLKSISTAFNVSEDQILEANPLLNVSSDMAFINAGISIIIPGGTSQATMNPASGS